MDQEPKTVVIFRVWKGETQTVLALFPEIDFGNYHCDSYEHVGQHGGADYTGCIARTRPAKPAEYRLLKQELESIGYNLEVRRRYNRRNHDSTKTMGAV